MRKDNFRSAKVMQVIQCVALEGNGSQEDMYREVIVYLDLEGNELAVNDPAMNLIPKPEVTT